MNIYILLFIVGNNVGSFQSPRYDSLVSINQEYESKLSCNEALGFMLSQVAKKADVVAAGCTKK